MGPCYICGKPATARDHDHQSGRMRGLLCTGCNRLAVHPELLREVLSYVEASAIGPILTERGSPNRPSRSNEAIKIRVRKMRARRKGPDYLDSLLVHG